MEPLILFGLHLDAQRSTNQTSNERGTQQNWLHHVGKATPPLCAFSQDRPVEETGHRITFLCARFAGIRREFLGQKATWEELNEPDWGMGRKGEDVAYFEISEEFFGYLSSVLTGR